jgi:hypothetical protein
MTSRMRLLRYGALALWAIALCAAGTPARIPDPQSAPAIAGSDASGGARSADAAGAGEYGVDHTQALREALVDLRPLDGAQAGGVKLHRDGTRVAEPSTLLLVSFGLFGLIAWNRRRR